MINTLMSLLLLVLSIKLILTLPEQFVVAAIAHTDIFVGDCSQVICPLRAQCNLV